MSDEPEDAVPCQRCGHGFRDHRPTCSADVHQPQRCGCPGFRWVDPQPAPDRLGYHRG